MEIQKRLRPGLRSRMPVIFAVVTPLLSGFESCRIISIEPTEPDVQLTAAPVAIEAGRSTTLSWNSGIGSHIAISPDVGVVFREMINTPTIGSRNSSVQVQPVETVTYIAIVWNAGAASTDSVTVTVTNPPPTPETAELSGSFSFDNPGTEAVMQMVRFEGHLVPRSTDTRASFNITEMGEAPPRAVGRVFFTKTGLLPGSWTIDAFPLGLAGTVHCPNVSVPGVIRLSVAQGLPECG